MSKRKTLAVLLLLLLGFWLGNQLAFAWRIAGKTLDAKLAHLFDGFGLMPSLYPQDLIGGLVGATAMVIALAMYRIEAKKLRTGIEHGSARWATAADIKPYIDPVFANNILLTKTERITMNSRPLKRGGEMPPNKNVLVIGGSGSGKTRYYVKPNLMQMHSSYVVTDPKGTLLTDCGWMLAHNGYRIRVLNLIDFAQSMRYNPFSYIRSEKDILKLVNVLIANTTGQEKADTSEFWVKAERLYYMALIGCIWKEAPEEEQNFSMLLSMLDASEVREDDPNFENAVDMLFKELEEKDPHHFAVRQYKKYKLAAAKTAKSILISCAARLAPFDIQELQDLTARDDLSLDTLGDEKTALFIILSDTDDTFNFLAAILYSQLFNLLCDKADRVYKGRLPIHVRFLLDEFANIGEIPKFERLISTIRSREISASIILQSPSQLKAIYKDAAEIITDNCDSTLILNSKGKNAKEISETLGKETIDSYNNSNTRGNNPSYGMNYQKLGKELMAPDEIAVMSSNKCILQLRGVRPFFSDKYNLYNHPNYNQLADANPAYAFDSQCLKRQARRGMRIKKTQPFETYEITS